MMLSSAIVIWFLIRISGCTLVLQDSYHGYVDEDNKVVVLDPILIVDSTDDTDICEIVILAEEPVPFEVKLLNDFSGEAYIQSTVDLDCETNSGYTFEIEAHDCESRVSNVAKVEITVRDVNEFAPAMGKDHYNITVKSGMNVGGFVLRVEASDKDCSTVYSKICEYEIRNLADDEPFRITTDGSIFLTRSLFGSREIDFTVVAYDCANKPSAPAAVSVTVVDECSLKWYGIQPVTHLGGETQVMPELAVEKCPDLECGSPDVKATVSHEARGIAVGCDRDTYSPVSQADKCLVPEGGINLLLPSMVDQRVYTDSLPKATFDGLVYVFNGMDNSVVVPEELFDESAIADKFSLTVWLKHSDVPLDNKETLVCVTDGASKDRHHLSVYIHNCTLTLMAREEYHATSTEDHLSDSWFRWRNQKLCDNSWHHVVLNYDRPRAELYIDSYQQVLHQITKDFPLHKNKWGLKTIIGACYHGREKEFVGHFSGHLAGMVLHPGLNLDDEKIYCLFKCNEGLQFKQNGATEVIDTEIGEVTIRADGIAWNDLAGLLRRFTYINHQVPPTPGVRTIHVAVEARCGSNKVPIDDMKVDVIVPGSRPTSIEIVLPFPSLSRTVAELSDGLYPLAGVQVRTTTPVVHSVTLRSCEVTVMPVMEMEDSLDIDVASVRQAGLKKEASYNGLILSGVTKVEDYSRLLGKVRYFSRYLDNRHFKIYCMSHNSELNISPATLTLSVVKFQQHQSLENVARADDSKLHAPEVDVLSHTVEDVEDGGHAVPIVITICTSFMVLVVVAVYKCRTSKRRKLDREEDNLDWDDSALTITINPLQKLEKDGENIVFDNIEYEDLSNFIDTDKDDDDDVDSECVSYTDSSGEEGVSCNVDQVRYKNSNQLEWDDTITF